MTSSRRHSEIFNTGIIAQIILFVSPAEISPNNFKKLIICSVTEDVWFLQIKRKHSESVINYKI